MTVNILGPEGSHDVLLRRLLVSSGMAIRPVVVYNYLQLRRAIMHMGKLALVPERQAPAPSLGEVVAALQRVPGGLRQMARKSTDTSIDERACNVPSDVAGVREFATSVEGGEFAAGRDAEALEANPKTNEIMLLIDERAGHDPSDIAGVREIADGLANGKGDDVEGAESEAFKIAEEIIAEDVAGAFAAPHTNGHGEHVHEGTAAAGSTKLPEPKLMVSHIGVMNAATNSEAILEGTLEALAGLKSKKQEQQQAGSLSITRDSKPTSEFVKNGVMLMEAFWYEFPLGKGLEKFEGTISTAATKHLMQHYTLRFQRNARLVLLLANQVQRHKVLKSVCGSVREESQAELIALINSPEFDTLAEQAVQNPHSRQAARFMAKILPFVSLVGSSVPWSTMERSSCIGKMLAMIRRYGPPSIFLTVAPDDVHSPLGIRLTIVITDGNDTFPAAAAGFLQRLAEDPEAFAEHLISSGSDDDASGLEDLLQRRAAQHPASMSMLYDAIARFVMEVVIGTPFVNSDKTTKSLHERPKGVFGRGIASFGVTEETGKGTHHLHSVGWCGALPDMCSAAGQDEEVFALLAAELEKQFKCEVPLAVHILDVVRRSTYAKMFRGEYCEPPDLVVQASDGTGWEVNAEMQRSSHVTAAGKQTHAWDAGKHEATCFKPPNGETGCRMGSPAVFPVDETRCIHVRDILTTADARRYMEKKVSEMMAAAKAQGMKPMLTQAAAEREVIESGLPPVIMEQIYANRAVVPFSKLTCGDGSVNSAFELVPCPNCWPKKKPLLNTGPCWLYLTDAPTEKKLAREESQRLAREESQAATSEAPVTQAATSDAPVTQAATSKPEAPVTLATLVAREEGKDVVIEVRRPKLPEAQSFADAVPPAEELKKATGTVLKSVWESVMTECPQEVRDELSRPEWAEVKQKLEALSKAELSELVTSKEEHMMRKMLEVFRLLPCANSRITCYNEMLTALLRCNSAPYLLGSRESSRAACFCASFDAART